MNPTASGLGRWLTLLLRPIPAEMRQLLARRQAELPEDLRLPWQVVGQHWVHCGYTLGPAYCSFGCTHCYLPANANRVPLPSLSEMKAQIDAARRLGGPWRGLQITGGDVVDAFWRSGRGDELVELLRHAAEAEVTPMIMTHGQVFLDHPDFLARLVREGGLARVSFHIDMTMAGRPGFPISTLRSEADLHPLRQAFVDLIHAVRKQTGAPLYGAQTVTVTARNLASVGEIPAWLLADRRRLAAFNTVSFQTEAAVGRTRFSPRPVTPEAAWAEICRGAGIALPRDGLLYGHPDCSSSATVLLFGAADPTAPGRRVLAIPTDPASRAFFGRVLATFGGIGSRGSRVGESLLRHAAVALRHPGILPHALAYAAGRWRREALGWRELRSLLGGRVGGLNLVLHNFMSTEQVHAGGEEVERRLAACSFRGAVRRRDAGGEESWEAVPMCTMNARERDELYRTQIERGEAVAALSSRI